MTETPRISRTSHSRRLSVVFVYVDGPDLPSRSWEGLATRLKERFPGWVDIAPRHLAVVPSRGNPDVLDAAIARCRALTASPQDPGLPTLSELRFLLMPGEVEGSNGSYRAIASPVAAAGAPRLELDAGIYLTGRAAQVARGDWRLEGAPPWRTERGRIIPLFRVAGWRAEIRAPWHNPSLFGSEVPARDRPRIQETLRDALLERMVRVSGPLGVGKSREVHRALEPRAGRFLWATAGRWGLSLAEQWLERILVATDLPEGSAVRHRLSEAPEAERAEVAAGCLVERIERTAGSSPWTLVADDWHQAGDRGRQLVSRLVAELGSKVQPVLAGRPGSRWPEGAVGGVVQIPAWSAASLHEHGAGLTRGLELPDVVRDRFLEAAAGNPLFLEEGLLCLVHRRELRRVYGSFFFAGSPDTPYQPSDHLSGHLLAEVDRLGAADPLSILAAAARPLPLRTLGAVSSDLGISMPAGWETRLEKIGWIAPRDTPWGAGAGISVSAVEATLRRALPSETASLLREAVGSVLRTEAGDSGAPWEVYELLRGTEQAASAILEAVPKGSPPVGGKIVQVLDALQGELRALRERGGDSDLELRLLWALLPLAHRQARLSEVSRELARAQELCRGVPDKEIAVATLQAELAEGEGKPREAEPHLRRALELAIRHGHRSKALLTLQLGRLLAREERYEEARRLLEQLLPELEKGGAESYAATCRFHLGNVALHERRFDEALTLHHRALGDRREIGAEAAVRASLCALGTTALRMGDYRQALAHFQEAMETLSPEAGEAQDRSTVLLGLGTVLFRLGHYSEATTPLEEAARLRGLRDSPLGQALCEIVLAELFLELHQIGPADEAARRALFRLSLLETTTARGDAARVLGRVLTRRGEHDAARRHLQEAETIHRKHRRDVDVIQDLGWMIEEALEREDREDVEVLVRRTQEALEEGPYPARGEIVDYQIFAALEWLEQQGSRLPAPPVRFLRRAYRELLRKTAYLDPGQRPHFLTTIDPHRRIVHAATRLGLSMPDL